MYRPLGGISSLIAVVRLLFDQDERRASKEDVRKIVAMLQLCLNEDFSSRASDMPSDPSTFSQQFLGAFFPGYLLEDLDPHDGLEAHSVFGPLADGKVDHVRGALADSVRDWAGLDAFVIGEVDFRDSTYLALVPKGVLAEDVVCILQGHSFPVVLRPCQGKWVLVGECFVLGLMLGQGWGLLRDVSGNVKMEEFEIV